MITWTTVEFTLNFCVLLWEYPTVKNNLMSSTKKIWQCYYKHINARTRQHEKIVTTNSTVELFIFPRELVIRRNCHNRNPFPLVFISQYLSMSSKFWVQLKCIWLREWNSKPIRVEMKTQNDRNLRKQHSVAKQSKKWVLIRLQPYSAFQHKKKNI